MPGKRVDTRIDTEVSQVGDDEIYNSSEPYGKATTHEDDGHGRHRTHGGQFSQSRPPFLLYTAIGIVGLSMIVLDLINIVVKTRFVSQDGIILVGNRIYTPGSIKRISTTGRVFFIVPRDKEWFYQVTIRPSKIDRY